MRKHFRFVVLIVAAALAFWGWRVFFPGPEKAIRGRLRKLAATASFEKEGMLSQAANAHRLTEFFTTNAVISVNMAGYPIQTLNGRHEVLEAALAARKTLKGLKVDFLDINISLSEDKQSAVVNLTGKAVIVGEQDFAAQEFNFLFRKVNGQWLIYRVESVKTLSLLPSVRVRQSAFAT